LIDRLSAVSYQLSAGSTESCKLRAESFRFFSRTRLNVHSS